MINRRLVPLSLITSRLLLLYFGLWFCGFSHSTRWNYFTLLYLNLPPNFVNLCLQWGSAYPYRMLKIPATPFYIQPPRRLTKTRKNHSKNNSPNNKPLYRPHYIPTRCRPALDVCRTYNNKYYHSVLLPLHSSTRYGKTVESTVVVSSLK